MLVARVALHEKQGVRRMASGFRNKRRHLFAETRDSIIEVTFMMESKTFLGTDLRTYLGNNHSEQKTDH